MIPNFLNVDPAINEQGQAYLLKNVRNLNPYLYAWVNPLCYTDPDGRDVVGVHGGWDGTWQSTEGVMNRYREWLPSTVFKDVPIKSLNFKHNGIAQSSPAHAANLIHNYWHEDPNVKIFWGHSIGADALAAGFGRQGVTYADEINLVMPRANFVADNLQMMSQNAAKVNVFMLSNDSIRVPGYGDRSFETMSKLLNGVQVPSNVNIMQIPGFQGHGPHGGALMEGPVSCPLKTGHKRERIVQ